MFDIGFLKTVGEYTRSNFYRAKVKSVDDPYKLNRIQLNIYGMTDDMPDAVLPWCELKFQNGVITYPQVDDIIWLFFENSDIFRPIYAGTIYTSTNLGVDSAMDRYIAKVEDDGVSDYATYRNVLRQVNNLNPDDSLLATDSPNSFLDVMTADRTWTKTFSGRGVVEKAIRYKFPRYTNEDLSAGLDQAFSPCPFSGEARYPWYTLVDGADWKSIVGGWKYLSATDINKGLATFPENFYRVGLNRYKKWHENLNTLGSYNYVMPDRDAFAGASDGWNLVGSAPTNYYDPEMSTVVDTAAGGASQHKFVRAYHSSPFSKMKIIGRQYWKQNTFYSPDMKSALELDDNLNYERLRLDFNFGEGGLEFSKAGHNGFELWTDGGFKIMGCGVGANGSGGTEHIGNYILALKSDLLLRADNNLFLNGTQAYLDSTTDMQIKSKTGRIDVVAGNAMTFHSNYGWDWGYGYSRGYNGAPWYGVPILSGPGVKTKDDSATIVNGWFPYLDLNGDNYTKLEDAQEFMNKLHGMCISFQALVNGLCADMQESIRSSGGAIPVLFANTMKVAMEAAVTLENWKITEEPFQIANMSMAWQGFGFEGEGQKSEE